MPSMSLGSISRQFSIIRALMMREMVTRFGREGLGFLWLIGEPLMFCGGVLIMWSIIKPSYEHGIRVGPFLMTGYMSLLLLRHQISYLQGTIQGNIGILYHRKVKVLHLFFSRIALEFWGATGAFLFVYTVLIIINQVGLPKDVLLLYSGWGLMLLVSCGTGLVMAGVSLRSEIAERITPLLTYLLIPISGAFFMASWIPSQYRDLYLLIPFPHAIEMIRAGVFGEFVETHYNPVYVFCWGIVLNVFGLLLVSDARDRVDIE